MLNMEENLAPLESYSFEKLREQTSSSDTAINQQATLLWLQIHGTNNLIVDTGNESPLSSKTLTNTMRTNNEGKIANEKNEDTGVILIRGKYAIAGIFDGATGVGDLPPEIGSPGKAAAVICKQAVAEAKGHESPRELILKANDMIRNVAQYLPLTEEQKSEALTAVGAIAKIDRAEKRIDIASVADCHIVVLHQDDTFDWLTENTSQEVELHEIAAAMWGAKNPEATLPSKNDLLAYLQAMMLLPVDQRPPMQPLKDPRVIDVIEENRRLENKAGGQPSLKGSDNDTVFIQEKSANLQDNDRVFLFTDGGYPGPLHTPKQQSEVVRTLQTGGIEELHRKVRLMEDADPDLRNPPRMKQYDDLVAIEIAL